MDEINLRLTLSFDGSSYSGWQRQKNAKSIQGEIEKALAALFGEHIRVEGIGRTDAGAHALSYTANFRIKSLSIPAEKITLILNRRLPQDIRIHTVVRAPDSFHSRFSAIAREYIYSIISVSKLDKISSRWLPFYSRYSYIIQDEIELSRLRDVCRVFVGRQSFKNFCYGYKSDMNFKRRIDYLRVSEIGPGLVFFIKGSGFLNGMIRSIISTCLNYGRGYISLDMICDALKENIIFPVEYRTPVPARGLMFKRGYFKASDDILSNDPEVL
jgi:tRNA pseudouridine38-40 synthase